MFSGPRCPPRCLWASVCSDPFHLWASVCADPFRDPRCRLRNPFRERQRSEAALPLRPQSLPPRGPLGETGGANFPRPASSSTSRHRLRQVAIPDITTALEQVCALWRVFLTALGKPSVPYATSTSVLVKQSNTRTATAYAQQDNSRRVLSPTRTGPNLH